jgi:2,3-bisphosphoglycerate-independent phosphoglycerate mutase
VRKTIIVHAEGFSAQSSLPLAHASPLERAKTPHLDHMAQRGEMGQFQVPGESRPLTGALALLALLGYDTSKTYTGSGPFVAAGLEVKLEKHDVAFLCDLVTLRSEDGWGEGKKFGPQLILDDPCAGGVTDEEARELLDAINEQLVSENIQFYLGHRHEHLMVWAGMGTKVVCRNPADAVGQPIEPFLPTGDGGQVLRELMEASRAILSHHELNQERVADGGKPANCLWLWSPGKALELLPLSERWPVKGVVMSSDNAVLGAGVMAGLHMVRVDAVQESTSAPWSAMAQLSLKAVEKMDMVYVHVPVARGDWASEEGMVKFWESLDSNLIGPLKEALLGHGQNRLVVVGTPTSHGAHSTGSCEGAGLSGFVLCEGSGDLSDHQASGFHERALCSQPPKAASKFFERLVVA